MSWMRGKGKFSICISSNSLSFNSSMRLTYLVGWSAHFELSDGILSVTRCPSLCWLCIGKLNYSPLPPVSPKPSRFVGAIGVCRCVSFSVLKSSFSSILFRVPFGVGLENTLTVETTSTLEGSSFFFFYCLPFLEMDFFLM